MTPAPRFICLLALPLALAACTEERRTAQPGTARGEILPGSASDAMLPLDSVRSQPPLAPKSEGASRREEAEDSASDDAGEPAADQATAADDGAAGGAEQATPGAE